MIFAEKLTQLRKKNGWSQEELAEQMNVSRQSVSKWEGAASVPDLEKMLRLSKLFGVSTDYLLKDDIEEVEHIEQTEDNPSLRRVTMEEANMFLEVQINTAKSIAFAVLLCILSPIVLFVLSAMSDIPEYGVTEPIAVGFGMIFLLGFVAVAVAIFILSGNKTAAYTFLEREVFETEYGVTGMVKERKERYKKTYTKSNIIGASMCISSLVPLFGGAAINDENDLFLIIMLSITFAIVGIGVGFFIRSGIQWASYEKLLQEGEYSRNNKEHISNVTSSVSVAFWLIATAIYLGVSFTQDNWDESWVVLVVSAVLYPAVLAILNALKKQN